MEDNNFKEFAKRASVWTAPTGLPIIAGAAYSVGTVMAWGACSIMSLFCSFFLPNQFDSKGGVVEGSAMDWFRKKSYSCYSHISDGVEYGFDSTAQFFREALSKVFPNVKGNLPASAVPDKKAEPELPKAKEAAADPKPKKEELDDAAGWQDQSWMQNNDKDNNGIDDSFAAKVESGRNDNDNNHGRT